MGKIELAEDDLSSEEHDEEEEAYPPWLQHIVEGEGDYYDKVKVLKEEGKLTLSNEGCLQGCCFTTCAAVRVLRHSTWQHCLDQTIMCYRLVLLAFAAAVLDSSHLHYLPYALCSAVLQRTRVSVVTSDAR